MNKLRFFLASVTVCSMVGAYTPTNVHAPYDFTFSQHIWSPRTSCMVGVRTQHMLSNRAFDAQETKVPVTQVYGGKESSLAMLEGSAPGTTLHALANRLRATQDGTRGMFAVTGDLRWAQQTIDIMYRISALKLPGLFSVGVHVPVISAGFRNIAWQPLTKSVTLSDDLVNTTFVASQAQLAAFALQNGNLDITGHTKTGLGDIACMLNWSAHFLQQHRRLQDVLVTLRCGMTLPTAQQAPVNAPFTPDFGRDGSMTVPLGAGLRLDLGGGMRIGMDVGATFIVRRRKEWRLKTSLAQTPYLQLSTDTATKEYGPEWRFTLYSQLDFGDTGLYGSAGYQFFKHTDSTFFPQSDFMSAMVINSSPLIDISESHNLVAGLTYVPKNSHLWRFLPEVMLQVTFPFSGKQIMSGVLLGGSVSLKF